MSSFGLEMVRSWRDQAANDRRKPSVEGVDEAFEAGATRQCLEILGTAYVVFMRSGPTAGIDEVASEAGIEGLAVRNLFATDDDLRLAYKLWSSESLLDHMQDEIDMVKVDASDSVDQWNYGLCSIWQRFCGYAQEDCQFHGFDGADADFFRAAADLMRSFIESGIRAGACSAPDVSVAAFRCVDVISRPLYQPGWKPLIESASLKPSICRSKARATRLVETDLKRRFADFLADLAPFIRTNNKTKTRDVG